MIIIVEEPKEEVYSNLLDLAFEVCDEFQLILRRDMGNIRIFDPILAKLNESFKEMKLDSQWASNILEDDNYAEVYWYEANEQSKKVIKELADSLYAWKIPNLPEDLSFFKNNSAWLVNNAHEEEAYIFTENKEEIKKILNISYLKVDIKSK